MNRHLPGVIPAGGKDKIYCFKKAGVVETPPYTAAQKNRTGLTGVKIQGVQMKRFILPLLLFFLFGIFLPVASFAEGNRSITILYTGFVTGSIDPLVGCSCGSSGSLGGLARRAHMIESIRKDKRSVLLLDCEAVFGDQKRRKHKRS